MSNLSSHEPAPSPGLVRFGALFLLSASSLLFEVLLTKLFANKLEHHYTFLIIGVALLGFGGSGVFVQLHRRAFVPNAPADLRRLARWALAYALAMLVCVAVFVVLPLDPAFGDWQAAIALPTYFLLFAIPFFLAGVPVSALLVSSGMHPARLYFWDLLGAAAGAAAGPMLLPVFGGYGSVVLAAALGLGCAITLRIGSGFHALRGCLAASVVFAAMAVLLLFVPNRLRARHGFDLVSYKALIVKADFFSLGPVAQTYWNPIARIDVSRTGPSSSLSFRYGLPISLWNVPLQGRIILVDGGANTRQFALEGPAREQLFLKQMLWAGPFVLHPNAQRALILGPGGGVDILIAKAFGVREIEALELNPDMAKLLVGRPEDPDRDLYARWLRTDETTHVTVRNVEARAFAHQNRGGPRYSVVLASGVDTLTAIQSSGNALSENFLYTTDAVRDYLDLLEPGGILALTHWHLEPPKHALKMFATYLDVLDRAGVEHPERRICVLSDAMSEKFNWESAIVKKDGDLSSAEIERLRAFAKTTGFQIVWEPTMPDDAPVRRAGDRWFRQLGRADRSERARLLDAMPFDVAPATDERPYFYWVNARSTGMLAAYDGTWIYGGFLFPESSTRWLLRLAIALCIAMTVAPALVLRKRGERVGPALWALPFFAATGLAFVIAENALFLLITLFVGGPLQSLSIVLPGVLGGYAVGSLLSARLGVSARFASVRLAAAYAVGFCALLAAANFALPALMGLSASARVAIALLFVVPFGAVLGLAVPWYMAVLKARDASVAWMWSLSAVGNVIGSLTFVSLCHATGVTRVFVFAAALYLLALGWAALTWNHARPAQPAS